MSSDEELLAQMSLQDESPDDPRQRRQEKPKYAKSQYTVEFLKEKIGSKVWVKCVSVLGPWASEKQLKFWQDYQIPAEEAIALDERRFAVILFADEHKQKKSGDK